MGILHSTKSKLPGMKTGDGHRLRNILVGIAYAFLLLTILGMLMGPAPTDDTAGDNESATDAPAEDENQSESDTTSDDSNASEGDEGAADDDESNTSDESDSEESDSAEAVEDTNEKDEAEKQASQAEEPAAAAEEKAPDEDANSGSDGPGPAEMEQAAANQDIEIEVHETAEGNYETAYYSNAQDGEQLAEEIGYISGLYAAVVDGGNGGDYMVIEVRSMNGEAVGDYTVHSSDAQAFANGNMTAEQYAATVLASGNVYEEQQAAA